MKENVIEGNKSILLFMGGVIGSSTKYPTGEMIIHSIHLGDKQINDFENQVKYHSSWDWLMPAWQKFRDLKLSLEDEGWCDIYSRHTMAISTAIKAYPINIAFERLVKAIQWYNTQKTNTP